MVFNQTIGGWAAKYNSPSIPVKLPSGATMREKFMPGTFADSIRSINSGEASIEANLEHTDDAMNRIGLTGANVRVQDRPEGVWAEVDILPSAIGQDLFAKIQSGIVRGLSVEFKPVPGHPVVTSASPDGSYLQTWNRAQLTGFAVTVAPFYPDARIVKAGDTMLRSIRQSYLKRAEAHILLFQLENYRFRSIAEGQEVVEMARTLRKALA